MVEYIPADMDKFTVKPAQQGSVKELDVSSYDLGRKQVVVDLIGDEFHSFINDTA